MSSDKLTLYHFSGSPDSRRVRIFLAEKSLNARLVAVDLGRLVTLDFAAGALTLSVPAELAALKRWYKTVSDRPSAAA